MKKHLRFVASFNCVACFRGHLVRSPDHGAVSQAAHVDLFGESGMGLKCRYEHTLPLCGPDKVDHHGEFDGRVKGAQGEAFWPKYRLDPARIAAELCQRSPYVKEAA